MVPQIDYMGIALVIAAMSLWSGAAEVDGREALARRPWLWGLAAGCWTAACRFGFGHGTVAVLFDQAIVALAMAAAITEFERRQRSRATR